MGRSMGWLALGSFILFLFMRAWWWLNSFVPLVRYVQATFVLLLLMWGCSVGIIVERFLRYRVAHNRSRAFLQQVAGAMCKGDLDQVIAIAARNDRSPIAKVAECGLASFQGAVPLLSDAGVIETAKRALRRSVRVVHGDLRRGLHILASIAFTAPLVGAFGTVVGITDLFWRGYDMAKSAWIAFMAERLAEALAPTALSLLVAVPTVWSYKYLHSELGAFDLEMDGASLRLTNHLTNYLGQRN
jgi:biopolymer transport protein ExbB/TolQ